MCVCFPPLSPFVVIISSGAAGRDEVAKFSFPSTQGTKRERERTKMKKPSKRENMYIYIYTQQVGFSRSLLFKAEALESGCEGKQFC